MKWYCIYTKAGQEDAVSKKLSELPGLQVFNPKMKRKKYSRSRLVEAVEELFPCYIFAQFELVNYLHMIRYTRGVRRFVGDRNGLPYLVDESIIACIQAQMSNGFVQLQSPQFSPGEQVMVTQGPLGGLTGIFVEELKPRERVIILLNTIRYQAKVEVPIGLVGKC
jgi:transcriptional antiterminator RfaH